MMMRKWTTCSRRSRPAGLTLIEVVAAIAILGTLLVGIVLAKSRHTRQLADARRAMAAAVAADELVAGWWASPQGVPIGQTGVVPDRPGLAWQTRVMPSAEAAALGAQVVRVVVEPADGGRRPAGGQDDPARVVVDLVLPLPDEAGGQSAGGGGA